MAFPVGWGTGVCTLGSGGNSTYFKVGLSPAPMATFPAAPPKIPYGGFSPVRLQVPGTAQFSRESSHVGRWLKWDPHIRHLPTQLALAFGIATAERFQAQLEAARAKVLRCGTHNVPATNHCRNLAKRFEEHGENYFRFITTPGVEPTNNLAEQAIRFVVIDRLITQGTRSERETAGANGSGQ